MTANDFKDFCKTLNAKFDNYYCGRLDGKKNHSLGVYDLRDNFNIAIGGELANKTKSKDFSLLVHWDNNYNSTGIKSRELQRELLTIRNVKFKTFDINYIQISHVEPIDVDTDEKGIFERVIEVKVYYNEEA